MTITKCVRCTHRDDTILVLQTQVSDGENTIISQTNYDEESRISDIFKGLQSLKDFQSSLEN